MNTLPKINSKSDAMVYAIEKADADVEVASKIYHLFADNMQLPDHGGQLILTYKVDTDKIVSEITNSLKEMANEATESEQEIPVEGI